MKTKIRLGLIGCGSWMERTHVPFLCSQYYVEIVAIADTAPEKRAYALAALHGVPLVVSSAEEMMDLAKLDAVIISTPHVLHFQQALAALRANLHVHVDKPLADTPAEVQELRSLAQRKQRILSLHTQKKYMPALVSMKQLLSRQFTVLQWLSCETHQPLFPDFYGSWREDEAMAPGGFLGDSGLHCIDTALHLMYNGSVEPVTVIERSEDRKEPGAWPKSLLSFRHGITSVDVSAARGPLGSQKFESFQAVGDGGTLELSYKGGLFPTCILKLTSTEGRTQKRKFHVSEDYKTYPLQLFFNSIRGDARASEIVNQNIDLALSTADILSQASQYSQRQVIA